MLVTEISIRQVADLVIKDMADIFDLDNVIKLNISKHKNYLQHHRRRRTPSDVTLLQLIRELK